MWFSPLYRLWENQFPLLVRLGWERICLQCGRPGFNPWVGKIPWRRAWQSTPLFFLGESHGQRLLSMGLERVDMIEGLTLFISSWPSCEVDVGFPVLGLTQKAPLLLIFWASLYPPIAALCLSLSWWARYGLCFRDQGRKRVLGVRMGSGDCLGVIVPAFLFHLLDAGGKSTF